MPNNKFHIAYITDNNYVMPTCVSIISLVKNKPTNITYCVHVISDNVSEKNKNIILSLNSIDCEIDIVNADDGFYRNMDNEFYKILNDGKTFVNYITAAVILKFNIPNFFKNVDTVLYLDSDMIINADISELFKLDISQYYLAAALSSRLSKTPIYSSNKDVPPLFMDKYFNSGVMLLNLKKLRLENITEKLINYNSKTLNAFVDQDALNAVFLGKILYISRIYNFSTKPIIFDGFQKLNKINYSNKYTDEQDCIKDQKIFHFIGKYKPWKYYMPWITDIFLKYYYISPYKSESLNLLSPIPEILEESNKLKEWRFPYEKIPKDSRIVLYGAGAIGKSFYKQIQYTNYCKVVLWIDRNYEQINQENRVPNITINSPDEINNYQYDYVLIANSSSINITELYLHDMSVPSNKLVTLL